MRLVYIAGPLRGKDRKTNIMTATWIQAMIYGLKAQGKINDWFPIAPHTATDKAFRLFDLLPGHTKLEESYFINGTLEMMRRFDAVLVFGEWLKSEGTVGEIKEAVKKDIPLYTISGHITPCKIVQAFEWLEKSIDRRLMKEVD